MSSGDLKEVKLSERVEVAASSAMYGRWLDEKPESKNNSPHAVLKNIMDMDLDVSLESGERNKVTVMETIMLKLAEKAMHGDLTATNMIIKEIQHQGVEKHQYIDKLPDDVKYLFKDVEFTDVDYTEIPDDMLEVSQDVEQIVAAKEKGIDDLINSWG